MDTTTHLFHRTLTTSLPHVWRARSRRLAALACSLIVASSWSLSQSTSASAAMQQYCDISYDPSGEYPPIPASEGPDLSDEAGLVLYLEPTRAVIELGACLYTVDEDQLVELELGDLDHMTVWIELPPSVEPWTLFVTRDGEQTDTIEARMSRVSITLQPGTTYAFELAGPEQPRPIKPLVVLGPSAPNPTP